MGDVGSNLGCLSSCWSYVATSLAARWRPRALRRAKMAPKSPKMSQDSAQERQDEPRWRPRAPRWRPRGRQMQPRWRFWFDFGSFWDQFSMIRGGFLVVRLNIKKHGNAHTYYFLKVFWGGFDVVNGSQIAVNPAKMDMLSPSWAVLGDLGKLGCLGRCWKQDGAEWSD